MVILSIAYLVGKDASPLFDQRSTRYYFGIDTTIETPTIQDSQRPDPISWTVSSYPLIFILSWGPIVCSVTCSTTLSCLQGFLVCFHYFFYFEERQQQRTIIINHGELIQHVGIAQQLLRVVANGWCGNSQHYCKHRRFSNQGH